MTQVMQPTSFKQQWARRLVRENLYRELTCHNAKESSSGARRLRDLGVLDIGGKTLISPVQLPPAPSPENRQRSGLRAAKLKVCIVGAGIAGLYTAMLLDSLDLPGVSYELLEASERPGGRIKTYHFSSTLHDYCDTGAMRYPKIPLMERAFRLFHLTGVPLTPYHFNGPNCPTLYNDILQVDQQPNKVDVFGFGVTNGGLVPDSYVAKGASQMLEEAFKPYKDALAIDFDGSFELLLQQDEHSTRDYLRHKMKYDYHTIQWLETMGSATGLFDEAFTESVIDSLDFDYPVEPVKWHCIDGGTSLLVDRMLKLIKGKVSFRKRVTSIAIDRTLTSESNMVVKVNSEELPRRYATVFNTTSLACMERMDLGKAELHPAQKDAIRTLHYDTSAKVAIKFRYPWWVTKCGITQAGVASTDLPLRNCVYPSYSLSDSTTEPAVLLCSYTWAQDAQRIGSLIMDNSPEGEEELVDLILRNLARLHAKSVSYEEIKKAYMTHYSWDWSKDQYTSGAFALFGPGQFANLYPYLVRPAADGKLHILGEAASAHHAWLVGSLDSAYRAVHQFLQRFELYDGIEQLQRQWGAIGEMETGSSGTAHLQVALGRLRPGEHIQVAGADDLDDYVVVPRGV